MNISKRMLALIVVPAITILLVIIVWLFLRETSLFWAITGPIWLANFVFQFFMVRSVKKLERKMREGSI